MFTLFGLLALWKWSSQEPLPTTPEGEKNEKPGVGDDPRLTFVTPFRNVRPEVRYVGDDACARCHPGHAETFRKHPMGRSLAPMTAAEPVERYDKEARNPFEALGFQYLVEPRGERVFHRETAKDSQGRAVSEIETEVHFAVGSGTHGRSYLINRDGYLFQSPITWYPQKSFWDLSPGYAGRDHHFGRPITADCLFCHCNHAEEVEGTLNRYDRKVFRGYAIGCERCHGPGELHVRRRTNDEEVEGLDDTIVNPRHLAPVLRDAVCEQCHLQGQERIMRYGRQTFDYRPGLPLHLFMSVFTRPAALTGNNKFVGHVEQIHASKCFRASAGKMGCTSCHDPHKVPAPQEKVAFYRQGCLACHADQGCSLPLSRRRERSKEDSCIACHMPINEADIRHTSISDHRIPRNPENAEGTPKAAAKLRPGELPLNYFHRHLVDPNDPGVRRDLGVALMESTERQPDAVKRVFAQLGLPLLEAALETHTEDVTAWDAKGRALWQFGRHQEALMAFETALAKQPAREKTLDNAANLAMVMGRPEVAIRYWERAVELDPWRWQHHYGLAAAHVERAGWRSAVFECQQALKLNPAAIEVRKLLVRCYLGLGEQDTARAEFDLMTRLKPSDADAFERWFKERQR